MNENDSLTLSEVQKETFKLLINITSVCELIGVKYYLAYGTLLGAVRHKGFIPWDDDVDLWMLREDYDVFFQYLHDNLSNIYPLNYCSRDHTRGYSFGFNRVTDMRFKYIDNRLPLSADYGVFVDVYPLDYVGDNHSFNKGYKRIRRLNNLYYLYVCNGNFTGGWLKKLAKKALSAYLYRKYPEISIFRQEIERKTKAIINQAEKGKRLLGCLIWWGYEQTYERTYFEGEEFVEFEGYIFRAPHKYKELLSAIYGDYMTLPPEEKRKPQHGYSIIRRA